MGRNILLRKLLFFEYPIKVIIFSKRSGGNVVNTDRAKRVILKDGSFHYELQNRGKINAPQLEDLTSDTKLILWEKEFNTFVPLTLNEEKGQLKPINNDDREFIIYNIKKSESLYTNPRSAIQVLEKVLPIVLVAMLIVGGLVLFKQIGDSLGGIQSNNIEIQKQQSELISQVTGLIDQNKVSGNVTPNPNPINEDYNW